MFLGAFRVKSVVHTWRDTSALIHEILFWGVTIPMYVVLLGLVHMEDSLTSLHLLMTTVDMDLCIL